MDEGILELLSDEELEGVIAHELRHMDSRVNKIQRLELVFQNAVLVASLIMGGYYAWVHFDSYGGAASDFQFLRVSLEFLCGVVLLGMSYFISRYAAGPCLER